MVIGLNYETRGRSEGLQGSKQIPLVRLQGCGKSRYHVVCQPCSVPRVSSRVFQLLILFHIQLLVHSTYSIAKIASNQETRLQQAILDC